MSLLLYVSVPLLEHKSAYGMYATACACGLQNAMVSTYSEAVVRTTHVSGMFTDLGIFLGHALRGLPVDSRRLRLCLLFVLDPQVTFVQPSQLKRPEVNIPDSVVDLFQSNVPPDTDDGGIHPRGAPYDAPVSSTSGIHRARSIDINLMPP